MTAFGRKRTLVLPDFGVSERPLFGKADIQLISAFMTANDPKRTLQALRVKLPPMPTYYPRLTQ